MKVEFKNKHLRTLYQSGKSNRYPLSEDILTKFSMRIQQLEAAATIHDLWKTPSLNFESLQGTKSYSVRVTGKYRLEMDIAWDDDKKTTGTIIITELSSHYGD